jgi:hypothetical protein
MHAGGWWLQVIGIELLAQSLLPAIEELAEVQQHTRIMSLKSTMLHGISAHFGALD